MEILQNKSIKKVCSWNLDSLHSEFVSFRKWCLLIRYNYTPESKQLENASFSAVSLTSEEHWNSVVRIFNRLASCVFLKLKNVIWNFKHSLQPF